MLAIYDRIVWPDVLWRAWEEVRANRGRPGIDGVSIEDVERYGVEAYLAGARRGPEGREVSPEPRAQGGDTEAGRPHAAPGHPDRS